MNELKDQEFIPIKGDEPPLNDAQITQLKSLLPEWQVVEREGEKRLERTFIFKNFAEALAFTNRVGKLAEDADHHPSILLTYGRATVSWWTHKIKGLHRNDFVMAAKTDDLYE